MTSSVQGSDSSPPNEIGPPTVSIPGGVAFWRSKTHPHLVVAAFENTSFSPEISPGSPSFIALHAEDGDAEVSLYEPGSRHYLVYIDESGARFDSEKDQAIKLPAAAYSDLLSSHPVLTHLTSWESKGDVLAQEHLAALLSSETLPGRFELFFELLKFIDRGQLVAMLPFFADQPGYAKIYPKLQRYVADGEGIFPLDTRSALYAEMTRFGWDIGRHSYGRPMLVDEASGRLTIGKFCSIAGFTTVVLGNHTTNTATTYPFALLKGYWPQSLASAGLVDHAGRDVVIGSDVWIGISAVILPGTVVGHGAIIGASAVARGNIPPYAIVAGNPGKIIKYRFPEAIIERLLATQWWDWPDDKVDRFIPLLLDPNVERFLAAAEKGDRRLSSEYQNIALGRPATQSSLFPWSTSASIEDDAAGLVSGRLTGLYQNHTNHEPQPWWQVDLGPAAQIHEVRVHNRLDPEVADRGSKLSLLTSDDGTNWVDVYRRDDPLPFGGLDGRPLIWNAGPQPHIARFLRVRLEKETILHLDQVEVFGIAA